MSQADLLAAPGLIQAAGEDLDKLFVSLDKNGDGKLSWSEMMTYFEKKGATQSEAKVIFRKADIDQSGFLDRAEFRRMHKLLKGAWLLSPYPRPPPPPPLDRLVGKGATRSLAVAILAAVALKLAMATLK